LLSAVQTLRVHRRTGTDQGLRNHALLVALLGSGLRVSEILNLERDQYTGKGFTHVQTKGGVMRDVVPLHRDARQVLDAWLKARQDDSPALFLTRTGRKLWEHSVILTFPVAAVGTVQTPAPVSRYTSHSAARASDCCWLHTTTPPSA